MGYTSTLQAVQFAPLVAREHTPSDVDKIVDHTISIPVFPTLQLVMFAKVAALSTWVSE